jgi:hypothetical protein
LSREMKKSRTSKIQIFYSYVRKILTKLKEGMIQ